MKLIDADALRKPIYAEEDNITGSGMTYAEMDGYNAGIDAAWSRIDNAPTVDAVEVIRCRDCKYNLANIEDIQDGVNINENWNACSLTELYDSVEPTDFCSHGERREK